MKFKRDWREIRRYSCLLLLMALCIRITSEAIFKFSVKQQMTLKKGHLFRQIQQKLPFPLSFCVNFFNVSNPNEAQSGRAPILNDVGPYCYKWYKEKIQMQDNEMDDTLTYSSYDFYEFDFEKSHPHKPDDDVTILHPLIVGMILGSTEISPALLTLFSRGVNSIFHEPKSIYFTTKVNDIIFSGIPVDCSKSTATGKTVCNQIDTRVTELTQIRKHVYLFSLFASRNGTLPNRVKIMRGRKKSLNLGRVVEVDRKKAQNVWSEPHCNAFNGTDGFMFPPFLPKRDGLRAYRPDLCRNLIGNYVKDVVYRRLPVRLYEMSYGDPSRNPKEKCYCRSAKFCPGRNSIDLFKCLQVPLIGTFPHFYNGESSYSRGLIGLNPNREQHGAWAYIEPLTGIPLHSRQRLQLNFPLKRMRNVPLMRTIPEVMHPLLWIEEGFDLQGFFFDLVTVICLGMVLLRTTTWVMFILGLMGFGIGAVLYFQDHYKVTKVADNVARKDSEDNDDTTIESQISLEDIEGNEIAEKDPKRES